MHIRNLTSIDAAAPAGIFPAICIPGETGARVMQLVAGGLDSSDQGRIAESAAELLFELSCLQLAVACILFELAS